jgi:hypothetical protein
LPQWSEPFAPFQQVPSSNPWESKSPILFDSYPKLTGGLYRQPGPARQPLQLASCG